MCGQYLLEALLLWRQSGFNSFIGGHEYGDGVSGCSKAKACSGFRVKL
jgi:hypothetical protein